MSVDRVDNEVVPPLSRPIVVTCTRCTTDDGGKTGVF